MSRRATERPKWTDLAIRSSRVEIGTEPRVSSIFPSHGCHVPARPSLHGVPSARFPRFLATTTRSDSSSPIPPRFVAFAWRYRRNSATGDNEVSQVPRRPVAHVPRFIDPGGTSGAGPPGRAVPTHRSSGVAFRAVSLVGFRNLDISGSVSAARALAVYASWSRSPVCFLTTTQDSLPAGGPAFAGRDSNPLGRATRFQLSLGSHGFLLVEASLGALTAVQSERRSSRPW